jgi:purine operon repressor
MEKVSRNNRIVAITKLLLENPKKLISLNTFTKMFGSAKSTISEDILIVRETLKRFNMGNIETISGTAGGVKYIVDVDEEDRKNFVVELCKKLNNTNRIIPGNFIYMNDIMYSPKIISRAGRILASFYKEAVDYVVTVETKGIPLAYEVAKNLGAELIIVRRENKVTEGATVIINYVSGTTGRIQNMFLSKKSMKSDSKCIFIDDFMKGGGTASGIVDLLKEFNSELVGIGVLMDSVDTPKKVDPGYISLIDYYGIDKNGNISIKPSKIFE